MIHSDKETRTHRSIYEARKYFTIPSFFLSSGCRLLSRNECRSVFHFRWLISFDTHKTDSIRIFTCKSFHFLFALIAIPFWLIHRINTRSLIVDMCRHIHFDSIITSTHFFPMLVFSLSLLFRQSFSYFYSIDFTWLRFLRHWNVRKSQNEIDGFSQLRINFSSFSFISTSLSFSWWNS